MNLAKVIGLLLMVLSLILASIYVLSFFGHIPFIDPELMIKAPVLLIVLFFFFVIGWVGYVMLTTPKPKSVKRINASKFYHQVLSHLF